jgi:uncharacterized zinc-type alcohol dehydrogenase-like protein
VPTQPPNPCPQALKEPDSFAAVQHTLDGIIDTASAPHDINALLGLLAPHGTLTLVGLPPGKLDVSHFILCTK